jgi:hypothetical protein
MPATDACHSSQLNAVVYVITPNQRQATASHHGRRLIRHANHSSTIRCLQRHFNIHEYRHVSECPACHVTNASSAS